MKQKWIGIRNDILALKLEERNAWSQKQCDAWQQYLNMGIPENALVQAVTERNLYYSIWGTFQIIRKSHDNLPLSETEQEVLNDWREHGDSRGSGWDCYWTGSAVKWRNNGRAPGG